jgi:hypothetical protein
MTDITTFSTRSNAKRAAEKAIARGTAPSIDYGIKERGLNGYEIVWHLKGDGSCTSAGEPHSAMATEEADNEGLITGEELQEHFDSWESQAAAMDPFARIEEAATDNPVDKEEVADDHVEESETEVSMPDLFPPGARVIVQVGPRKRRTGAVDYRVDATSCRVKLDGAMPSVLCRYSQLTLDDGSEPIPMPRKAERKPRAAPTGNRKPSKSSELDAAAARGEMPAKPIITSKANQLQYQKRFDQLEKWALADDWNAVRAYEVKGINSYAKMVKQYRERLLAAHAAVMQKVA